eukprot:UN03020
MKRVKAVQLAKKSLENTRMDLEAEFRIAQRFKKYPTYYHNICQHRYDLIQAWSENEKAANVILDNEILDFPTQIIDTKPTESTKYGLLSVFDNLVNDWSVWRSKVWDEIVEKMISDLNMMMSRDNGYICFPGCGQARLMYDITKKISHLNTIGLP